jgi:hypothetical protein
MIIKLYDQPPAYVLRRTTAYHRGSVPLANKSQNTTAVLLSTDLRVVAARSIDTSEMLVDLAKDGTVNTVEGISAAKLLSLPTTLVLTLLARR